MRTPRPDLSLRVADTLVPGRMVALGILGICFVAGLSLAWIPPEVVFGLALIAIIAFIGIRWPYAGLILYMCMEYLRPTERFPMLAPLHLTRLVAVFVLVGWLVRRRRDGFDLWVKSPENLALLGLFGAAAASVLTAYWKAIAFETTLDLGRMVVVFILIANIVNTPKRLAGFMTTYVLLNAFISAEQLFHYGTTSAGPGGLLRVGGAGSFFGEDGDFALAINVALPFIYYLAWSNIKPALRVLCGAAALMLVCSIIATGSRGGTVGLCSVLLVVILRSRKRFATALVIVGVLATAWVFAPPAYRTRVVSIAAPIEQDLTAQTRLVSWKAAREMFTDHPVLGVGAGNFLTAFVGHYGGGYGWSTNAHNVFYQTLAELGLCGFVPFIALIACALIRGARLNARLVRAGLGDTTMAAYAAALLPATVAFVVSGSFQTPLYYPHIYVIAALGVALNNTARPILEHCEQEEVRSKWRPVRKRRLTPASR
jgi:putative inorganic carbon (HCO3(-)) transporter